MITIEICMGSSCFARGNRETIRHLENLIEERGLGGRIALSGRLCMDFCSCGPHILIDGERHDLVAPEAVRDIVLARLEERP